MAYASFIEVSIECRRLSGSSPSMQPVPYKVYVLRVRGSYKDLCVKLGQERRQEIIQEQLHGEAHIDHVVEVLQHELSPVQMNLFEICRGMNFKTWGCRPSWANGAHIFVLPAVADELEDAFQGVELGKSDVVVSPELLEVVQKALRREWQPQVLRLHQRRLYEGAKLESLLLGRCAKGS